MKPLIVTVPFACIRVPNCYYPSDEKRIGSGETETTSLTPRSTAEYHERLSTVSFIKRNGAFEHYSSENSYGD
ncbi:MAG: hypothetical protein EXS46_01665 [Candidatus Taylorbacteria bacterium]|nr:hypothetical protein [Candidatus Taylorbacteria bacterium]